MEETSPMMGDNEVKEVSMKMMSEKDMDGDTEEEMDCQCCYSKCCHCSKRVICTCCGCCDWTMFCILCTVIPLSIIGLFILFIIFSPHDSK